MPKARSKTLSAAEIVAAIEKSRAIKDRFFTLFQEAYRMKPREAETIRQAYFKGEITLEKALRELDKLARR